MRTSACKRTRPKEHRRHAPSALIRILLVDSHAVLRAGLRRVLDAQPALAVVGEASTGEEALQKSQVLQPDVVVLELALPGMNGLELIRQLHRQRPAIEILVLTMYARAEYLIQALLAGAAGYVVKLAASQELVTAIQAVHRGQLYLSPEVAPYLAQCQQHDVHQNAPRPAHGSASAPLEILTDREREVLRFIAEGYTTQEIARHLCLSPRTVETYRAHLMRKLGLRRRAELVHYALRWGVLIPESWDIMATTA
jgi:two-component system response regulator NreC